MWPGSCALPCPTTDAQAITRTGWWCVGPAPSTAQVVYGRTALRKTLAVLGGRRANTPIDRWSSACCRPTVVADSYSQRIQVFSNEGQFKFRFGAQGHSPGQLRCSTGVAVDTNGDIIVADSDNHWSASFSLRVSSRPRKEQVTSWAPSEWP